MRKNHWKSAMLLLMCVMLTACGNTEIEDYATNEGYTAASGVTSQAQQENGENNAQSGASEGIGIPVEQVKIGVIHLTSPDGGKVSGYLLFTWYRLSEQW